MGNIWGFLNQTIYVSSMAVLILLIKMLMKDKLPARWQYGIWIVLAACLFIPAGSVGGYIIPQLHILLETAKYYVETGLNSAYTVADVSVYNRHILPVISGRPASITDMLFVAYLCGIAVTLIKYLYEYIRLAKIIAHSPQADSCVQQSVKDVAENYSLPVCDVKAIDGLPSAFVFGIVKPVLVLPLGKGTDDKVILHELLHLKYKDLWQNIFWSVMKALHWPNPFLRYVFKSINNDMESLRDYRVMELLKGEQRREYGRILLSMTNEKYPSAFGTTSISNGSRFISERIEAIARFKLYPKGMGLVALCIIALLAPLTVTNGEIQNFPPGNYNHNPDTFTYNYQHARARMTNCKTVAGAIDTYAKALLTGNELYSLAVKPGNVEIKEYHLADKVDISGSSDMYYVVDLEKTDSKTYIANLLFRDYTTNLETPGGGGNKLGYSNITVPIKIVKENGWKVYQTGNIASNLSIRIIGDREYTAIDVDGHKPGDIYEYISPAGVVDITVHKVNTMSNSSVQSGFMFSQTVFDHTPKPHGQFDDGYYAVDICYTPADVEGVKIVNLRVSTTDKSASATTRLTEYGGSSAGPDRRHRYVNINANTVKATIEHTTSAENTAFTEMQKETIANTLNKYHLPFAQLKFTKDNFASLKKTDKLYISVMENGRKVCDATINLKEGKLYDQTV